LIGISSKWVRRPGAARRAVHSAAHADRSGSLPAAARSVATSSNICNAGRVSDTMP